ncbi:hypothetical protein AB0F25_30720 [Streptomyces wedmorensis]|uniref:hypothetical protein n=1 Tax=Streptomyces wedmorensis TaxID=43759 RepID=UPI0034150C90
MPRKTWRDVVHEEGGRPGVPCGGAGEEGDGQEGGGEEAGRQEGPGEDAGQEGDAAQVFGLSVAGPRGPRRGPAAPES